MTKKICIFNAENYFQNEILNQLQSSDIEVYSTLNDKTLEATFKRKPNVRKILKKTKPKLLKNYLFNSDIIILDLLANEQAEEDVNFICQTFTKRRKPETYKKIVLISSLLTWKETETNYLNDLFEKFDTPDTKKWESIEEKIEEEDANNEEDAEEEESAREDLDLKDLKTPRGQENFQEELRVMTEKKQEGRELKGVKSEMIMANAKDLEQKLTENGFAFKSNQMKNKDTVTKAQEKSLELYSEDSKKMTTVKNSGSANATKKENVAIRKEFIFNRKPDPSALHLKQLEDKILKLPELSGNIEVILVSVGVVYGSREYHLQELFKKAFGNTPLEYSLMLQQSKTLSHNKSPEGLKSLSITNGPTMKSKFSKERTGEGSLDMANIGLVECRKLSEFVQKLCDEEMPETYKDLPQGVRNFEIPDELAKDPEYLKKNYIHINYSEKLGKEYVQIRKGKRKEKLDHGDFSIVGASGGDFSNSLSNNQNKSHMISKIPTNSQTEASMSKSKIDAMSKSKLSVKDHNLSNPMVTSGVIMQKESYSSGEVTTSNMGNSNHLNSSSKFALSKISYISEKKKDYLNYIDTIFGKFNKLSRRKSEKCAHTSCASPSGFRCSKS